MRLQQGIEAVYWAAAGVRNGHSCKDVIKDNAKEIINHRNGLKLRVWVLSICSSIMLQKLQLPLCQHGLVEHDFTHPLFTFCDTRLAWGSFVYPQVVDVSTHSQDAKHTLGTHHPPSKHKTSTNTFYTTRCDPETKYLCLGTSDCISHSCD